MRAEPRLWEAERVAATLEAAGVRMARQRLAASRDQAVEAARAIGSPVAVKLMSPELPHKSDSGGVVLGLSDPDEAGKTFDRLAELADALALRRWRVLVQEMVVADGPEVFAGVHRDPVFGPVLRVGAGGRLVELFDDQAVRLCPVDEDQAREMLAETRLATLLGGYRGGRPADVDDLVAQIAALSRVPEGFPEIEAVELNPLVPCGGEGFVAVDARVVESDPPPAVTRPVPEAGALDALLDARSVVVVGASTSDERKAGTRVLGYLRRHGYAGTLYVVHPSASDVLGVPAYPSVDALPTAPDVACIAVPKDGCEDVLDACGRRGVRAAVVLTAGFAEAGDRAAQDRLGAVADRHGMALCGPNTIGLINTTLRLHLCFSQAQEVAPRDGGVAIVAQSGALGGALLSQAWERGLGVGRFVSVGNQARLSIADFVAHLAGDADVRVLCLVIEGASDGAALREALALARACGKRVVALKVGRSEAGADVALSHTGSLAGDGRLWDAVFAENAVIGVSTLGELLDVAEVLECGVRPAGRRVAIVSTSGGACSLSVDVCEAEGLDVPELPPATREALAAALPAFATTRNPIDVTAQVAAEPELLGRALEIVLASGAVDAVLVAVTTIADPQAVEIARDVAAAAAHGPIPVVVSWTIAPSLIGGAAGVLAEARVPLFAEPAEALAALGGTTLGAGEPATSVAGVAFKS